MDGENLDMTGPSPEADAAGAGEGTEPTSRQTPAPGGRERREAFGNPVRRAIEFCGKHPFATGLFALLSLFGLVLALVDFQISRSDARSTDEQLEEMESAVRALPDADRIDRLETAVENLGERVGSNHRGGVFLFEEPIEGIYFNEWWAHPISSDRRIEQLGQAEVTIRGSGKTVDFSGVMSMNCENGRYLWRGPQNFVTPITAEEADELMPREVQRNVYRLFCQ